MVVHNQYMEYSQAQYDMIQSQEKCQNTKTSLYLYEITSEKCSDSHLQSYRNQANVLNFLSQQSEYWPIKWVEIIHCRAKAWPGLVLYPRLIADWITQAEIGNMFNYEHYDRTTMIELYGVTTSSPMFLEALPTKTLIKTVHGTETTHLKPGPSCGWIAKTLDL